jgi:transposase
MRRLLSEKHVFRIVLSHSRKGYSEAVWRQTTDEFIRCLENAFHHFGGLPKAIVLDNLKAGVAQPDWYDPEPNPKLRSFADHYGLAILPTRPRTPRHKGKIESGIGYVKGNALKGLVFASLEEENP